MAAVDDVVNYLEAQGLAGGTTGWSLLRRRIMDEPAADKLVVVGEDGGGVPEIKASAGLGSDALEDPAVMVTVRGEPLDSDASLAKADAILGALHGLRSVTLTSGGDIYLGIRAQASEPIFAGYDEKRRPIHTISFRLLKLL